MSKYNRYLFCKRLYNCYLILILDKDKIISFDEDLKIIELYGIETIKQEINYLILDGLNIKLYKNNNNYFYYFKISLIKDIIDYIMTIN